MIWRVHRQLIRELAVLTVVCSLGLTFLFSAIGLYQVVNQLGFTPHITTLLSFAPTLAVSLLPLTLPISALFAGAWVFGRMRADRELLLIAASGVSPWRPFLGLIPLGIAVAFVTWYGVSELGPDAYADRHRLQRKALADLLDHPPQGPRELRFPGRGGTDPSLDMSYASVDGGEYEDLTVLVYNSEGLLATLHARSARIEYLRYSGLLSLTRCFEPRLIQFNPQSMIDQHDTDGDGRLSLKEFARQASKTRPLEEQFRERDLDGNGYLDGNEARGAGWPTGTPLVAERIDELRMPFDFGSERETQSNKALGTVQLLEKVRRESDKENRGASAELVRRSGLTLGGLVLPLLGALLAGMINHPNRLLAIGVGVIPAAVGYYPVMTAAATLAEKATLSPIAAALLAPAAAVLAIALAAWRVTQGRWR
jgi:lipopolysaccharide export LptBFGC system permease protein LptF